MPPYTFIITILLIPNYLLSFRLTVEENPSSYFYSRPRRNLIKNVKLNRQYQECLAPNNVQGHCKHTVYCPIEVTASRQYLDYLCIIEGMHVGVCCPDDILLLHLRGAQIITNLPSDGRDDEEENNTNSCGLQHNVKDNAEKHYWPWLAALVRKDSMNDHFCGGALITDQHILTAAHCFQGYKNTEVIVRLGEYNFKESSETRHQNFEISHVEIHEEYNAATYENDIAIVRLKSPTVFNSYIWPICISSSNESFVNKSVIVTGWGQVYYAGPKSDVLLDVKVPVWENDRCKESFTQRITDNNLCAAAYEGGKDSCLGDSGGPLMYQLDNGKWISIGIVSWGIGCGNKDQPGIYTRVDKYLNWIFSHTN